MESVHAELVHDRLVHEIHASIGRVCDLDPGLVREESTLDDLDIDSLTAAEIVTDLEIRLGHDLPVDVLRRLIQARTVGDIAGILETEYDAARDARP